MPDADTSRKRVLIDPSGRTMGEIFAVADLERLRQRFEVVWAKDRTISQEEFDREKATLFAVVSCGWRFGALEGLPALRAILDVAGGLPGATRLDYDECFRRRIRVLTCAPAFGSMVAEMALAMALDCIRELSLGDRRFRSGTEQYLHAGNADTFTLFGRQVGFIGYGSIARNLRPLLDAFGCCYSAFDPWLPDSHLLRAGVTPRPLDELLSRSDVIFVLAVPTKENHAMLSRRHLELIRPRTALVLVSRSHVVDFDALTDLVRQGRFRAAIDVFPDEPMPPDHPIRGAEHAVLSAHRAGSVTEDLRLIGRMVVDDLEAIDAGIVPMQMQRAEPETIARL